MKNCVVLGSGRSGTSMAAGLLANSGYYMGDRLVKPRPANPKGFFESATINLDINERLMDSISPFNGLGKGQRWLDIVLPKITITVNSEVSNLIQKVVSLEPFCYKDPRFCYTLPAWLPYLDLENTVFLCVFRHPNSTICSILKECADAKYLRSVRMTPEWASKVWYAMYLSILRKHRKVGNWLFFHYDSFFCSEALDKLEAVLETGVDRSFPERKLRKKIPSVSLPARVNKRNLSLYSRLLGMEK